LFSVFLKDFAFTIGRVEMIIVLTNYSFNKTNMRQIMKVEYAPEKGKPRAS